MTTYYLSCAWCPAHWQGPNERDLRALSHAHRDSIHPQKVRPPEPPVPAVAKVEVAKRYGLPMDDQPHPFRCAYCAHVGTARWSPNRGLGHVMLLSLEWEHVIPRALGGSNQAENIVWACRPCNRAKKNRTPDQWGGRIERLE